MTSTTETPPRPPPDTRTDTRSAPTAPPPPPGPGPASSGVGRSGWLVGLALVGGVALDIGLRGGVTNLSVTIGLLVALAIVWSRPELSPTGRALVLTATLPALGLSTWSSPWLALGNVAATLGLGVAAVAWSSSGRVFDTSATAGVVRVLRAGLRGLTRLAPLAAALPRPRSSGWRTIGRVARAVLVALPLAVLLAALLASADAVFGSLLSPDIDLGPAVGHVVVAGLLALALVVGGLAVGGEVTDHDHRGRFSAPEVAIVLGVATAVLGLFVASQLLALTDAGRRLVSAAGLTPAEYARSGFFQLCWASVVVVAWLAVARFVAAPGVFARPVVRWLAATVPILATGLVAVSLRRMTLYDQAFGMTMLRLAVVVAAVWIGVVLVLVAARNLGLGADRRWVPGAAVVAGLVLLAGANVVNPEAFVVRHNVARVATAEVDTDYLTGLSDDAVPALAAAADAAEAAGDWSLQSRLRLALGCDDTADGVARLNLAVVVADDVRSAACP